MSPMNNGCNYEGAKVLLVEGADDCHVVMAVCAAHDVPQTFGIYACGNDDRVLKRLNALIVQPDPPGTIGIVLDADHDANQRWREVRTKLRAHNYIFPEYPAMNGTIIDTPANMPKLGIWLMPNNRESGMLEDFCLTMVDAATQAYVSNTVMNAQKEGRCTFKPIHFTKAVIHTYLAWQNEPGSPLGLSITRHALQAQTEVAIAFTAWLNRLFCA